MLTEPRNALVKQYQRLFELDGVELEFTAEALEEIADLALVRGTGARGLRAILEEDLLKVMFDVPSRKDIEKVVVSEEVIRSSAMNPLRSVPRASAASARAAAAERARVATAP